MRLIYQSLAAIFLLILSSGAHAYVGPGAGLTAIGSILAFVGALLLLILGFLWYPIKRLFKIGKKERSLENDISKLDTDNPE